MDFETVVQTRRSVRTYSGREVPEKVLDQILESARLAPAAGPHPWRMIVVRDHATRTKIAEAAPSQDFLPYAPVIIACCAARYPNPNGWMGDSLYLFDASAAIDHLLLAARNAGLGTCWVSSFPQDPIRRLLKVPFTHDIVALVTLGYPMSGTAFKPTAERLPLEQLIFMEKFGQARIRS